MNYRGRVKNGVVVVENPEGHREDDEVIVEQVSPSPQEADEEACPTLYEQFKSFIGAAKGLPSDLAENHDHYLHGRPKK
jgi:hypothetical protein